MKSLIVGATVAAALTVAAGNPRVASLHASTDREDDRFVYAVDVLCQFSGGTTINIHNPHERTVTFIEKGVPLVVGQGPTPPHPPQQVTLKRGWALLIGCDEIAALGGVGTGGSGNVIVESDHALDVWAVYTSIIAGGGIGETRGPVRVPPTRVGR
jgi:hypothetical protein